FSTCPSRLCASAESLPAQRAAKSTFNFSQQLRYGRVDLGVRQSTCSILYKHQNCKAFLANLDAGALVDVKQCDTVDGRRLDADERAGHRLAREVVAHADRKT